MVREEQVVLESSSESDESNADDDSRCRPSTSELRQPKRFRRSTLAQSTS